MPDPETESAPRMPRWVKVLLLIVIALAVGLVVSRMAGLEHGPGLHGG